MGSVLRFDPDPGDDISKERLVDKPLGVPQDNTLVGELDFPYNLQYAWGFRNPWGMSFDSQGRLFMGDVGRSLFEEVGIVRNGGNYGWNIREGTHCFSPAHQGDPPEECSTESARGEPLLDPIIEYPHVYVFGDVAYSPVVPSGALLVASNETGDGICPAPEEGDVLPGESDSVPVHKPNESSGTDDLWEIDQLQVPGSGPRLNRFIIAFGEGQDGELYVLTNTVNRREAKTGKIHKLVPPEEAKANE